MRCRFYFVSNLILLVCMLAIAGQAAAAKSYAILKAYNSEQNWLENAVVKMVDGKKKRCLWGCPRKVKVKPGTHTFILEIRSEGRWNDRGERFRVARIPLTVRDMQAGKIYVVKYKRMYNNSRIFAYVDGQDELDRRAGTNRMTRITRAYRLYKLGYREMRARNIMSALKYFDRAIEINPDYASAYRARCIVYGKLRQYKRAIGDCKKAIVLKPKNTSSYLTLGVVLRYDGKLSEAEKYLTKAIKLDSKSARAFYLRAKVYRRVGKNYKARSDCRKTLRLDAFSRYGEYCRRALSASN